ncbi:MAG: HD domain-containing protein [Hyphomicrobiales bacterium]|nr:HD domain-containing protein [Hyphomicrobiales bacterium]
MVKPKFYRDPVQLQIRFDPVDLGKAAPKDSRALSWLAQKIIATPQFQRLRFIRQNGLANFVFHGAEHSRFTHSMGVHAVARRMYECICRNCSEKEDDEWKLTSAVAALAHDIGHGPFSHTLEEILKENDIKFHHEEMTRRFLVEDDSPICKALKEVNAVLPSKLEMYFDKTKRGEDNWAYKIVSSQLDADRLDYVQRDALYAGLRGHGFDFERLLDLLSHHDNKIAVHRGAIIALESYLVAIDQMYRSIYYHRTVRAATQMLLSLFKRAVFLHKNGDKGIFPDAHDGVRHPMNDLIEHGSKVPLDRYVNLTEFGMWHLIDLWQRHKDQILSDLASRILRRDLFKAIQLNTTDYRGTRQLENNAKKLGSVDKRDSQISY